MKQLLTVFVIALFALAACDAGSGEQQVAVPTATLANIVSMTPRYTATPVPSKTPLPTFTYTPSTTPIPPTPSDTPEPTGIPPVIGIVSSTELVNVREGPGGSFGAFEALAAGTGVEILGKNEAETWLLVRLEDGREGWMFASLVRIQASPTPFPTTTPTPNLTALFLGTPLPTALIGGGTVTPTPPRSVTTPTLVTGTPALEVSATNEDVPVPIINVNAINQTATALVGDIQTPIPSATADANASATRDIATPDSGFATPTVPGVSPQPTSTRQAATPSGQGVVRENAQIFALCDQSALVGGSPPPTDLAAGSTVVVWWAWLAKTEDQIRDHLNNAAYEVYLDDTQLINLSRYRTDIRPTASDQVVYWYVPFGEPLEAGLHRISYRVTWNSSVTDGYQFFGPGTNNAVEEGSCTFTVQ